MTLAADSTGKVLGKFTIPANVPAGSKLVNFAGQGGSQASASFVGQGVLVEDIRTVVTRITRNWYSPIRVDPIAQTFTLNESLQIASVDLYVFDAPTTRISVHIRESQLGYPTQNVIAETRKEASTVTGGSLNNFEFSTPVRLDAGVEYALVVMCDDATGSLGVAVLGKFDADHQQWITQQPYNVGVLLTSSNASTWSVFQDRDLAFQLNARQYTQAERLVDLGTVTLTGATDLLPLTMIESPTAAATGQLELTMPDGSVLVSGDAQHIQFTAPVTGSIAVKARLKADANASAAIHPGTQIVAGAVQSTGTYVSNAVDADASGCTVKVVYNAVIPSGATVVAEVSGVDSGDTFQSMTAIGTPKLLNNQLGLYEYQFQRTGVMEARVRVRLTLTGSTSARPRVRDLRVIVL